MNDNDDGKKSSRNEEETPITPDTPEPIKNEGSTPATEKADITSSKDEKKEEQKSPESEVIPSDLASKENSDPEAVEEDAKDSEADAIPPKEHKKTKSKATSHKHHGKSAIPSKTSDTPESGETPPLTESTPTTEPSSKPDHPIESEPSPEKSVTVESPPFSPKSISAEPSSLPTESPQGSTMEGTVDLDLVGRTLMRLYSYLKKTEKIDEKVIIKELEFNTINQQLREKMEHAKIELQGIYEENQALREMALRSQVEFSDEKEQLEMENNALKEKLRLIDEKVKEELEKRTVKYQDIIRDLRNKLGEALKKNESIKEVSESILQMQERIKSLFDQNDTLEQQNIKLKNQLQELENAHALLKEEYEKAMSRLSELKKKDELQVMVIAGLKRQLGEH